MRILVTGARGFIGRHCIKQLLQHEHEVHGTTSSSQEPVFKHCTMHKLDLFDLRSIQSVIATVKPSHLLHLAWCTEPPIYWSTVENLQWVQSSLALAKAFAEQGGKRLVATGSCAEYDWNQEGYCLEQTTPLKPDTLYGTCKASLYNILNAYSKEVKLSFAWGRLFCLYGPYEHPRRLAPSVISSLLKHEPALCSTGTQIRDFLYVEDAASALVALVESNFNGPVNIASGQPVEVKEVIMEIAQQLNAEKLVKLGALPARINEPPLLVGNAQLLNNEIGFLPAYDLKSGIAHTINWWKNELLNPAVKTVLERS